MRKFFAIALFSFLLACNNKAEKNETATGTDTTANSDNTTTSSNDNKTTANASNLDVNIDGTDMSLSASALVSKDKKNLQPGAPWFAMITATNGPNEESLILNFVFDTKPGTYPVVGVGLNKGSGDNGQVFGGLMGGQAKIMPYKVTLTDVKDLGDNKLGGHKWSISGTFEDMIVPANSIMLYDKTKNHPAETVIKGGSFTNITFDDNWEEILEKAFEKTQDK
jgi:hypothetical protein